MKRPVLFVWIVYTIFAWLLLPILYWLFQPLSTPQYLAKVTAEFGIVPWMFVSIFIFVGWLFRRWNAWLLKKEQEEKEAEH